MFAFEKIDMKRLIVNLYIKAELVKYKISFSEYFS